MPPSADKDRTVGAVGAVLAFSSRRLNAPVDPIGSVLVPITVIPGGFGRYAVLRDTEGNRIALHEH